MRRQCQALVMAGIVIVALSAATLTWLVFPRLHAAAAGSVSIATDKTLYSDTEPMQVTVTNGLSQPIYAFDTKANCSILELQQQISSVWQPSSQVPCPQRRAARPIMIGAGAMYTATIHATTRTGAPSVFTPGSYRLALSYGLSPTTIDTTVYSAVVTVTSLYGDGSDGSLNLVTNTADVPLDASVTGSTGSTSLFFSNASSSLAGIAGKPLLIHQSQGSGAGTWMRNKAISVSGSGGGTIVLDSGLNATYTTGAQVIVLPQYTNVTVNSGVTWSAKAWNGATGGILAFLANGTVTLNGTVSASQAGFRGADGVNQQQTGRQGEGTNGSGNSQTTAANGNGGGGGQGTPGDSNTAHIGGGGGGGNATTGGSGGSYNSGTGGSGGDMAGTADLSVMVFGGGGGTGGTGDNSDNIGRPGGNGGGIVFIAGRNISMGASGVIASTGGNGVSGNTGSQSGAGGGAGGSVWIKAQSAITTTIAVGGGAGAPSSGWANTASGGNGSAGRIFIG
jgi:hypothetical protein